MTRTMAKAQTIDPQGGYVVPRRRRIDGVGDTLRSAFGDDGNLPRDLNRLLKRLGDI